jgi:predicted ribosome quality control (RQC) complex YloA/Tae2 family protein
MKHLISKGQSQVKIEKIQEYEKYRWFFTSNDHLVIGGKNAEQNEEIISHLIKSGKNYMVMHTKSPGSPFSVIQSEDFTEKDLEETAIFTGCFSRAWREKDKRTVIDIFKLKQITKNKSMKTGTFGVSGQINKKTVELKLYLTAQKGKIRAIPQKVKDSIAICPGNINKSNFAEQIAIKLEIPMEEILQALPTGGSKICSL